MSTAELITQALQTLAAIVWAAIGWVIAFVAVATVLILATAAGLGHLYQHIRPHHPKE